jgi:hydrogenase maturation protein HypF
VTPVQHHLAHALACMLEHDLRGPVLAVTWDGTGLGADGAIWGGECLRVERAPGGIEWERLAHLRPFRLPGGDAAAREPARALAGAMHEVEALRPRVDARFRALLENPVNAPWCTSAGRLFDAVAALTGVCVRQTYEGHAAAMLEHAATGTDAAPYPMPLRDGLLDWSELLARAWQDADQGRPAQEIAAAFHAALADGIRQVAHKAGERKVVLTGGCFQNRLLTECTMWRLQEDGFEVLLARRLPPNDGGIAAGQMVAAQEGLAHVSGDSGTD